MVSKNPLTQSHSSSSEKIPLKSVKEDKKSKYGQCEQYLISDEHSKLKYSHASASTK